MSNEIADEALDAAIAMAPREIIDAITEGLDEAAAKVRLRDAARRFLRAQGDDAAADAITEAW